MRVRFRYVTYDTASPSTEQQDLERLFHELWRVRQRPMLSAGDWRPPIDVYETPSHVVVKMELAGVPEDAIDIALYADHLVVSGSRQERQPGVTAASLEGASYLEAGIHYGPFRAEVRLPRSVDSEGVSATLENGFLIIDLPKVVKG